MLNMKKENGSCRTILSKKYIYYLLVVTEYNRTPSHCTPPPARHAKRSEIQTIEGFTKGIGSEKPRSRVQGGAGRMSKGTLALSLALQCVFLHFCCNETLFFKCHHRSTALSHTFTTRAPSVQVRGHCRPWKQKQA